MKYSGHNKQLFKFLKLSKLNALTLEKKHSNVARFKIVLTLKKIFGYIIYAFNSNSNSLI